MASYSSSGVVVSWNCSLLPGVGGVLFPFVFVLVWLVAALVAVAAPAWRAVVSRVARAPGFLVSGARMRRAVVSLWAWRAWSSSVST